LYLVGSNKAKTQFRLLKIDRTYPKDLVVSEDTSIYSRKEIHELLNMVDEGNKKNGGLTETCVAFGIVGFVRFLQGYYLLLITKRRKVGQIGRHHIYGIDDTAYLYIPSPDREEQDTSYANFSAKTPVEQNDETRYRALFFGMDLTKDFSFSYTYDLTNTLQFNMINHNRPDKVNWRFAWNHHLIQSFAKNVPNSPWILPIIHGYFAQASTNFSQLSHLLY
jgi:hypothetical protein